MCSRRRNGETPKTQINKVPDLGGCVDRPPENVCDAEDDVVSVAGPVSPGARPPGSPCDGRGSVSRLTVFIFMGDDRDGEPRLDVHVLVGDLVGVLVGGTVRPDAPRPSDAELLGIGRWPDVDVVSAKGQAALPRQVHDLLVLARNARGADGQEPRVKRGALDWPSGINPEALPSRGRTRRQLTCSVVRSRMRGGATPSGSVQ